MTATMRMTAVSEPVKWELLIHGPTDADLIFTFANGNLLQLNEIPTVAMIGMACEEYLKAVGE